jgi:hypothetical protein
VLLVNPLALPECCIYHKPRKFDDSDSEESDYEAPVSSGTSHSSFFLVVLTLLLLQETNYAPGVIKGGDS